MFNEPMINEIITQMNAVVQNGIEIPFPALVISAVIGLIVCLFGLKLVRFLNAICGLAVGAVLGILAAYLIQTDLKIGLAIVAAAALILTIMSAVFKKFGAFLLCLSVALEVVGMFQMQNFTMLAVTGVAGIIIAVLTMIWFEPLVIIVTSLSGGMGLGNAVAQMVGIQNPYITLGICAAGIAIGLIVQFMMKSREIGRREARHSRQVKEEISIESEIDRARSILDLDDEEEDEDEYEE
ncbi:MAG: hypothetical protein PUG45_08810 [bacterium]|nr:hypothetical protein [bacterium]